MAANESRPDARLAAKRSDYLSWDECFMAMAILAGQRSKDPNTQVGACIVSADNRILSIGYNGAPNGMPDESFPWNREGDWIDTKYPYVVHAERNAILNYRGSRDALVGSTLYVALFPCNECAKEIIQSGISKVVYLGDKHHDSDECVASRRLLESCGVTCRRLTQDDVRHKCIEISLVDPE